MKKYIIKAKKRLENEKGKNHAGRLRRSGRIPVNLISKSKSVLLSISEKEFKLSLSSGLRSSSIVTIEIEGEGNIQAVVKELQRHPIHNTPLHIDFYRLTPGECLLVTVGIEPKGSVKGVKAGGALEQYIRHLKIRALPESLQEVISIDVTNLDVGQAVYFNDLNLPSNWEVAMEGNPIVMKVSIPRIASTTQKEEVIAQETDTKSS